MQFLVFASQFVVCSLIMSQFGVHGHGRFVEPPSRSSMWRFGFTSPINYNDNELFCGGFQRQWGVNEGKCGVCGDPWDGERQNEAGGKYANGIIARHYKQGQTITVNVDLTANHLGYFEFRLCPHNTPQTPVTQSCLDNHLLRHPNGHHRFNVTTSRKGIYSMEVVLPAEITCSQCVIQWKYNTGNSWGCDGTNCCVGCGPQEQFYGCADVAVSQSTEHTSLEPSATKTTETADDITSKTTTTTTTTETTNQPSSDTSAFTTERTAVTTDNDVSAVTMTTMGTGGDDESPVECEAVGAWAGNPRITAWCIGNCAQGFCPRDYCSGGCRHLTPPQK